MSPMIRRLTVTGPLLAALVAVSALPVLAQPKRELSQPIVTLTPTLKKNAEMLDLTDQQIAALDRWISTMPVKRKAVEADALSARAALREAILSGTPRKDRVALAEKVAGFEAQLLMMRSDCADHWRSHLTQAQFDEAVGIMTDMAGQ